MKNSTIFQKIKYYKKSILTKLLIAIIWFFIWEIIYRFVNKEILIVSPFDVFKNLIFKLFQKEYWITCFYSIYRIMIGYILGIFFGIITAIISYKYKFIYEFLYPFFNILKSTPVVSFIIIALVWIKTENVPIFIVFIMVIPIIWTNIYQGILEINNKYYDYFELASIFEFKFLKKMKYIYSKNIFSYVLSSFTVSLGLAWKSGIAAEVISSPKISIGSYIYDSKIYLETLDLFTWTITVIIISFILEIFIKSLLYFIFNIKK